MSDPQTGNLGLYQPTRGSDSGLWDLPVNANSGAVDSLAANVAVVAVTGGVSTITTPPNSGAAWAGPYQSQSGILQFTGTLTNFSFVVIPRSGFFIVQNNCVVGNFAVVLRAGSPGGGRQIGLPPGEAVHVISDGTNMDYVSLGRINQYEDWAVSVVPQWVTACTVQPYLTCNGTTFSAVTYPNTAAYLGGTTLPDARGRSRFMVNQGTSRITSAGGFGIDGDTLLAAGGSEIMAQDNFPAVSLPVTDLGHNHSIGAQFLGQPTTGASSALQFGPGVTTTTSQTGITVATGGSGRPMLPPGFAAGITVIRAG